MHRFSLCIVLCLLLAPLMSVGETPRPKLVQSLDLEVRVAPMITVVAGTRRLVYELHLTNFTRNDVALTHIEVLDAARGRPLAQYRDAALSGRLGRPGLKPDSGDVRQIAAGMRAVLFLWIDLDRNAAAPERIRHNVEFEILRASGREAGKVHGGEHRVSDAAPIALDPPLRGGPWVALYDPSMAFGHRTSVYTLEGRARIPARFAIDWVRLERDGSRARGDDSQATNWHGYGAEVLAVANGVVADARDDMQPSDAVSSGQGPMPLENASGNYVVLDIGEGRHAIYEHLQYGSVKVRAGDRVRSGQVIARLGNTGSSSSGPHLHFHLSDAPSLLAAEGLPYVFRSFEVIGGFDAIGDFAKDQLWRPAANDTGGPRVKELPQANVVLLFPER